jgi:hypothetical protein
LEEETVEQKIAVGFFHFATIPQDLAKHFTFINNIHSPKEWRRTKSKSAIVSEDE